MVSLYLGTFVAVASYMSNVSKFTLAGFGLDKLTQPFWKKEFIFLTTLKKTSNLNKQFEFPMTCPCCPQGFVWLIYLKWKWSRIKKVYYIWTVSFRLWTTCWPPLSVILGLSVIYLFVLLPTDLRIIIGKYTCLSWDKVIEISLHVGE